VPRNGPRQDKLADPKKINELADLKKISRA
jgi:hypothetical protein